MKLYVVFKEAVFRHECGGVFSSLEAATEAAYKLIAGERDDHHRYLVKSFDLDVMTTQIPPSTSPCDWRPYGSVGNLIESETLFQLVRRGCEVIRQ